MLHQENTPYEIREHEGAIVASNGTISITVMPEVVSAGAFMRKRRSSPPMSTKPAGEAMLPLLNELAGELLKNMDMPGAVLKDKLIELAITANGGEANNKPGAEWCFLELPCGTRVYVDEMGNLIVSKDKNIFP